MKFSVLLTSCLSFISLALLATGDERSLGNVLFAENKGQWAADARYIADMNNGKLTMKANGLHFLKWDGEAVHEARHGKPHQTIQTHYFQILFSGNANPSPAISSSNKNASYRNYFLGSDVSKWQGNVSLFHTLKYKNVWPGIDAHYYGSGSHLKYDFILQPGADAGNIALQYNGIENATIRNGEFHYKTSVADVKELAPYAYQIIHGKEVAVRCRYVWSDKTNELSFDFPKGYDKNYILVIDPTLVFATYTGSTADNFGFTATYDNAGALYAGGIVYGLGYPVTTGAFQTNYAGGQIDISITKYSADGSAQVYSTYIGGDESEQPNSLVVNSNNQLVVLGTTSSFNYPTTANASDNTFNGGALANYAQNGVAYTNGSDIVVTVLSAAGNSLVGSTYIGGAANDGLNDGQFLHYNYGDVFRGEVIVNAANEIFVASCTHSLNFPVTGGAYQTAMAGNSDACVFKLSPDCQQLLWATYLGGSLNDAAYSIKLDSLSRIYVTGGTTSTNFPTTNGVINPTYMGGNSDGFLARLSPNGNALQAATYLGTNAYDQSFFVEIDTDGDVYVTGQTLGTYPITAGVYSNVNGKQFIHKLNNTFSSTLYSTAFGSGTAKTNISPTAFLVDVCENVYVSGWGGQVNQYSPQALFQGNTTNLPLTPNAYQSSTDGSDFYYFVLNKNAGSLLYATYFGGNVSYEHVDGGTSRFDRSGIIYQAVCAGCGSNDDFPTTPGVWSNTNNSSNCNLGALKMEFNLAGTTVEIDADPKATGCVPLTVQFTATLSNVANYQWYFGDGFTSLQQNPLHTYTDTGTYQVMLIGIDSNSCNIVDTAYLEVWVRNDSLNADFLPNVLVNCDSNKVSISALNYPTTQYSWSMGDNTFYNTPSVNHVYANPGYYNVRLIVSDTSKCNLADTFTSQVFIPASVDATFSVSNSNGCKPLTVNYSVPFGITSNYNWSFGDGGTSSIHNPTHTFTQAGVYTTRLIVTDSTSCNKADTAIATITVIDSSANAAFQFIRTFFGCDSVQITVWSNYTGEDSQTWDWGDGSPLATTDTASHVYSTAGTFTITHILVDSKQICKPIDTSKIAISLTPLNISYTIPDTGGCLPFTAQFIGNSALLSTNFVWLFGDGSTATSDTAYHTYNTTGTFNVVLLATDTNACVGTDTAYAHITVINDSAIANFTLNVLNACDSNLVVDLINTSTNAVSYVWNFGDGTSSVNLNESHNYTIPGTYYITLTATDTNRCHPVNSITKPVTLKPNSFVDFDGNDVCLGNAIQFTNFSNPAAQFVWHFGNGATSTLYSPAYLYSSSNTYDVMLTMTDTSTCNVYDTIVKQFTVFPQPTASFITLKDTFKYQAPVPFINKSFLYNSLMWDFGDGQTSTDENPEHVYNTIGWHTVCLTAVNGVCTDTFCKNVFIYYTKLIGVPNAFSPNGDGLNDVVKVEGKGIIQLLFRIYNRWGEKVFESNDQSIGWNGYYKGVLQEMEAYAYHVDAVLINGENVQLKGNITLLR